MGNVFVNIPVPANNGSGAAVNMGSFGLSKTISVAGPFVASVNIEISNEVTPTAWAPIATFNVPDGIVLDVACRWMRTTVSGYKSGTPSCDVGADDSGASFASLPAPSGNGAGAAIDVSALPLWKTVTVGGPFTGNVQLEVSEDGTSSWSQIGFSFSNPGQQTQQLTAHFMRVVRTGSFGGVTPTVDIAACTTGGFSSVLPVVAGSFQPAGGGMVNIVSQTGQFANASAVGTGVYAIDLAPIAGITDAGQVMPFVSVNRSAATYATISATFGSGIVSLTVKCFDGAGAPLDSVFYVHLDLINPV